MFTISLMSLNVIEVKALMNHKEDVKKIKVRIGAAEKIYRGDPHAPCIIVTCDKAGCVNRNPIPKVNLHNEGFRKILSMWLRIKNEKSIEFHPPY